jgi:probable F420-dependent oxidoreductase
MKRWSLSLPLPGLSLADHEPIIREAEDLGYTDAWSSEADACDAFTPLALTAAWTKDMRLGTAIASVYTRGPLTLANHALAMAEAAPNRFVLGLGSASQPIVENWNGFKFDRPLRKVRDTVEVLRGALRNERVEADLPTQKVRGLRLTRPMPGPVPIYIAALREQMLSLAGEVADGVIINWLSASDVPKVVAVAKKAAADAGKNPDNFDVACRIFVYLSEDTERVRAIGKRAITAYLNVPTYALFHDWLGRAGVLAPMWEAWKAGDRKRALEEVPNSLVDELVVHGNADQCREGIQAYVDAGVTVPVIANITMSPPDDWAAHGREAMAAVRALAPK